MIIDRNNYPAHRPRKGDEIRHHKTGELIATVVRIRASGALLVHAADINLTWELLGGRHWEAALEGGLKLTRPDADECDRQGDTT